MTGRMPIVSTALFLSVITLTAPARAAGKSDSDLVARGKYLVTIGGCGDCHSPKIDAQMTQDPNHLLAGRLASTPPPMQQPGIIVASMDLTAWAGPWGNTFAANLTPDPETGLGKRYDEAKFIKALRTGKKPEGEPILPPMPWPTIGQMTDRDLGAVWAYLQTIPPVKNNVRAIAPAAPAK